MEPTKSKIQQLFREVKIDASWSFAEASRSETTKWTHGYHRYPAKFIPQLVERLFDKYVPSKHAHINDPFFGSGTTIVSAISRGYIASGTDINGIAYLMTQAKSTPIEPTLLDIKIDNFISQLKRDTLGESQQDFESIKIPERNQDRIDYWFPPEYKNKLGHILNTALEETDLTVRRFLLVAFSHILKSCSIWLQRSTKPTRDMTKTPRDPYLSIKYHLARMTKGNYGYYRQVPETIRSNLDDYLRISLGDARYQPLDDSSVDLIVTSSPYVTSYEYADLHQLSTIWLEFADDFREYRKDFIGSGFRSLSKRYPKSMIAEETVSSLQQEHSKTAQEVREFFCDMDEVFNESYRVLKYGGHCCYVIGNTVLKGVDILNAQIFAESMIHCGFDIEKILKREIPSKILPQTRNKKTGRFSSANHATSEAYPTEYILIGTKRR